MMPGRFTIRLLGLGRHFGLVLVALALLAAPVGSVGHTAMPDTAHHAGAAQDATAAEPCHGHDSSAADSQGNAGGAEFCHVVSGPFAVPIGTALPVLMPSTLRLGAANSRLPGGLDIPPPLGPPRTES